MSNKSKYQTKKIAFSGKEVTLYSLDGVTWSSRKDELSSIAERHEASKVTAAQLRGEGTAEAGDNKPAQPLNRKPSPFNSRFAKKPPTFVHPAVAHAAKRQQPANVTELSAHTSTKQSENRAASKSVPAQKKVKAAAKTRISRTTTKKKSSSSTKQKKKQQKRKAA